MAHVRKPRNTNTMRNVKLVKVVNAQQPQRTRGAKINTPPIHRVDKNKLLDSYNEYAQTVHKAPRKIGYAQLSGVHQANSGRTRYTPTPPDPYRITGEIEVEKKKRKYTPPCRGRSGVVKWSKAVLITHDGTYIAHARNIEAVAVTAYGKTTYSIEGAQVERVRRPQRLYIAQEDKWLEVPEDTPAVFIRFYDIPETASKI